MKHAAGRSYSRHDGRGLAGAALRWTCGLRRAVAAGLAGAAAVARSQPPAGALTFIASSGGGSARPGLHRKARRDERLLVEPAATSSRFLAASWSPCWAASANHL